jgi:Ca-activated chloride channel family protein
LYFPARLLLKRFVNIIVFFFSPLLAFTQYYMKGHVRDETGNALQNATLYLHSSGYVYDSGIDGSFGIPTTKKTDTLSVSLEGYVKQKLVVDAASQVEVRLKKAPLSKNSHVNKLASFTQNLKREQQQQWFTGDESYASIVENRFINATAYPNTGMTLNVDRASYSNVRRFLSMNTVVPPDAVRIEEMLNYFNFNYREPSNNKTFEIHSILTACPWNHDNQLLFAQINSKKIALDSLPPSHLVFLIDVSGSMDMPNRLPLLKSGFKALVNNMRAVDSVSIVVYGGAVGIALPTSGGDEKEKIFKTIDSLQPGGSTPGESGIKLAYSVARNHFIKGGNNRIILATDGDFNVGLKTDDELEDLISKQREAGIYLTCLGIGMGNYKDSKIQTLAQRGNGNFAYLDSYAEAEKVLLKEFTQTLYTVADDAYLNVYFNPAYVKEYRLIGFDNKAGAIKDTAAIIEGGEIGSTYSTLIAFEIIPTPEGREAGMKRADIQMVKFNLQYKIPDSNKLLRLQDNPAIVFTPFEELPKEYQFATGVIMFGGLLNKSKFLKETNWNNVLKIATDAADQENYSQKEFLGIVQQARTIYSKVKKKKKEKE